MKINLNKLNTRIKSALWRYNKAESNLKNVITEVQKDCSHPVVIEMNWGVAYNGSRPHRICAVCRFEEMGSNWSGGEAGIWSKHDYSVSDLGNNDKRMVIHASCSDDFYAFRLP